MWKVAAIAVVLVGCGTALDEHGDPLGQLHAEPAHANPRLRTRMRQHGEDLRQIEDLLLRDRLAEARVLAFWLARPVDEPALAATPDEAAVLATNARRLGAARTTTEGMWLAAQVAGACGACHARMEVTARFERDVIVPDDGPARHRWAADRLWDGIVGASGMQWRAGLAVFARDLAGYRVAAIAEHALVEDVDRASTYGRLRIACMTCHAVRDQPARVAVDR